MIDAHQNLNGLRDPTTPISGTVCRPLGVVIVNRHTKFDVSTITCNKDKKGNAKYVKKNSRFEPPSGGLTGNAQGLSMA